MKIQSMFQKDIDRDINGVIKVSQNDQQSLKQELSEYIITKELRRHFATFFDNYVKAIDNPTDKIGVWISGFFGSGKSHFLKMLSYLLSNKEVDGKHAFDYFADKFDDPMMYATVQKCVRIPTESILFNIDIEGPINKDKTAVLRVFAKVFYNHCGFYGEDLKVAKLERFIDKQGKTEAFRAAFKEVNGDEWVNARDSAAFFEDDVVEVLQSVLGISETAARNWFNGEENADMSIKQLVSEIKEYVDSKEGNFRLLFCVDEVGQYIGDDGDLMMNLQSLVEEIGDKCRGKVWVMVTSQEAITIKNCYSVGNLGEATNKYGIVASVKATCQIENCYAQGVDTIAPSSATIDSRSVIKSSAEMQTLEFATTLGSAFRYNEGGYPTLTWEVPTAKVPVTLTPASAVLTLNGAAYKNGSTLSLTAGEYTYIVSCKGYKDVNGTVEVKEDLTATPDAVSVTLSEDESQWVNVTFDVTPASAKVSVKDGEAEVPSKDGTYKLLKDGNYTYTATTTEEGYEDASGTVDTGKSVQTVALKEVESIKLGGTYKTEYYQGDALDTTGLTVTVTYTDKSTRELTEGFRVTGFDSAEAVDSQTITVTYKGVTATYTVKINEKTFPSAVFNGLKGYAEVTYSHNSGYKGEDGKEFVDDGANGLKSNSAGMSSSQVTITIKFFASAPKAQLTFDYKVSSEAGSYSVYDGLQINNGSKIGGTIDWTTHELTVNGGDTVTLSYTKDFMDDSGVYQMRDLAPVTFDPEEDPEKAIEYVSRLELDKGADGITVTWASDSELLNVTTGNITAPESGKDAVTLTATVKKGDYSEVKTFTLCLWSAQEDNKATLADIKDMLAQTYVAIQPMQGVGDSHDEDLTDALLRLLEERGHEGITAEYKGGAKPNGFGSTVEYIDSNGKVTWIKDELPNSTQTVQYTDAKFTLTCGGETAEVTVRARVGRDIKFVQKLLEEKAGELLTWETIRGKDQHSAAKSDAAGWPLYTVQVDESVVNEAGKPIDGVSTNLLLPVTYSTTGNAMVTVTWMSRDADALTVSDNKDGTYTGVLNRPLKGEAAKTVRLIAQVTYNFFDEATVAHITGTNGIEVFANVCFDITVAPSDRDVSAEIEAALDKYPALIRDFVNKSQTVDLNSVTADLQMPRPAILEDNGIMTDSWYQRVKMVSETPGVLAFNGYHAMVYRPLPGEDAAQARYTITITQDGAILGQKTFTMTIQPFTEEELTAAEEFMQLALEPDTYWNGIKGENTDKEAVAKDLTSFVEILPDGKGGVTYVKANFNDTNGTLGGTGSYLLTDNARLVLALTALGRDPADVGGKNLLTALQTLAATDPYSTIYEQVFALLALNSNKYGHTTGMLTAILSKQQPDGSWKTSDKDDVGDVDMTAMALQALAPYYNNSSEEVDDAVDKALTWLSAQYKAGKYTTSESCAQVVVALSALGSAAAGGAAGAGMCRLWTVARGGHRVAVHLLRQRGGDTGRLARRGHHAQHHRRHQRG